jgi:hypothetical protein
MRSAGAKAHAKQPPVSVVDAVEGPPPAPGPADATGTPSFPLLAVRLLKVSGEERTIATAERLKAKVLKIIPLKS